MVPTFCRTGPPPNLAGSSHVHHRAAACLTGRLVAAARSSSNWLPTPSWSSRPLAIPRSVPPGRVRVRIWIVPETVGADKIWTCVVIDPNSTQPQPYWSLSTEGRYPTRLDSRSRWCCGTSLRHCSRAGGWLEQSNPSCKPKIGGGKRNGELLSGGASAPDRAVTQGARAIATAPCAGRAGTSQWLSRSMSPNYDGEAASLTVRPAWLMARGNGTSADFWCRRAPIQMENSVQFVCMATLFAFGAGDGNRTRTVSLGTLFELRGFVLGSWRVSRSRAAWSVPWMPAVMAR